MTPFLKHNRDTVFIRRHNFGKIKRGQILLFKRTDGRLIMHRIRKVLPDNKLLMNGDGQAWCEEINYNQIIAEVFKIERNGKSFFSDSFMFKLWDFLWFPIRPIRPFIFKLSGKIKTKKDNAD